MAYCAFDLHHGLRVFREHEFDLNHGQVRAGTPARQPVWRPALQSGSRGRRTGDCFIVIAALFVHARKSYELKAKS
jgi:hypothetical protein